MTDVMACTVDRSRYPLVVVTFEGATSDADFESYLAEMDELLTLSTRHAIVVEGSRAERPPPAQRKRQADWMRDNQERIKARAVGMAFVITSPIVRGGLTAILWMAPMAVDSTVVATYDEAEQWALERIRAEELPMPPASSSGDPA